ncbi:cellulase family glycosylhydrolase [candidate division KSB1 bacterium]|nr:cellulase family glycosylhydrolase [candidate division KSB1 bacterium]
MFKIIVKIEILILIILFQTCYSQIKPDYARLIRGQDEVYYHVPVGLCEDYPEETTTMEIIRNDFELLKRTGVDLLRISFGWDAIEYEKDKYDWLFWDDFVKLAVDEYGITLIPYICYTPRWNSEGDSLNFWNHTPIDYDEFGEFVGDLVKRYKNRIFSWELWNEPDITVYWSGTAEDYSRLVKIGSKSVREADPDAIIVLGGLAHRTEFTLELFRDHNISPYVDVVNIHNYFETWHSFPVERIVDYIGEIYDIVQRYGNNQSIWMAEVGYSTFRKGGYVSSIYDANYEYEHTPAYQAVDLFKRLTLVLSTQKIAAVAWYEIKDLPQSEEVIGDEYNNRHLGVVFSDYTPKPAEKSLVFFNKLFSQKYKTVDQNVKIECPVGSESQVYCFENQDGSVIIVGWLKTKIFGKHAHDDSGDAKDNRKEVVKLTLPGSFQTNAAMYDHLGNETTRKSIKISGQNTVLENIELNGDRVTIIKLNK